MSHVAGGHETHTHSREARTRRAVSGSTSIPNYGTYTSCTLLHSSTPRQVQENCHTLGMKESANENDKQRHKAIKYAVADHSDKLVNVNCKEGEVVIMQPQVVHGCARNDSKNKDTDRLFYRLISEKRRRGDGSIPRHLPELNLDPHLNYSLLDQLVERQEKK